MGNLLLSAAFVAVGIFMYLSPDNLLRLPQMSFAMKTGLEHKTTGGFTYEL